MRRKERRREPECRRETGKQKCGEELSVPRTANEGFNHVEREKGVGKDAIGWGSSSSPRRQERGRKTGSSGRKEWRQRSLGIRGARITQAHTLPFFESREKGVLSWKVAADKQQTETDRDARRETRRAADLRCESWVGELIGKQESRGGASELQTQSISQTRKPGRRGREREESVFPCCF